MSTDAELIYNALLRAERRLEEKAEDATDILVAIAALDTLCAIEILREEIGNGIARERP